MVYIIEGDTQIGKLRWEIWRSLVEELNENEGWNIVANAMNSPVEIFSSNTIRRFSRSKNVPPAECFLNELNSMGCTVEILGSLLEECSLFSALSVISIQENKIIMQQPITSKRFQPTEKIAIIIGNQNYEHILDLNTVENDVETFTQIVENHGFQTYTLLNKTKSYLLNALKDICDNLKSEAYVLLYYVGHGFEFKEKFLLPVESSDIYTLAESISENEIKKMILDKDPALLVMLLDMCLETPSKEENPAIYKENSDVFPCKSNRNLICGCSTSSGKKSYERINISSGVYMKHLKEWLPQDIPILEAINHVNNSITNESCSACYHQMPTVTHNTIRDYYLSDPIKELYDSSTFSTDAEVTSTIAETDEIDGESDEDTSDSESEDDTSDSESEDDTSDSESEDDTGHSKRNGRE